MSGVYNLFKFSQIKTLTVMGVVFLSACGGFDSEIKSFKAANVYSDLSNCLGVEAKIELRAFKSAEISNDDTLIIEAKFDKNNEKFYSQWLFNKNTKLTELAFFGKQNSDETVIVQNNFANLCGKTLTESGISKSLQLSSDKRKNKKYGMALATFGGSETAKNRTASLAVEINKLNIENSRAAQLIDNSFAVITTNNKDELSTFHNLVAQTLEKKFADKGMRLDIQSIIIVTPFKELKK